MDSARKPEAERGDDLLAVPPDSRRNLGSASTDLPHETDAASLAPAGPAPALPRWMRRFFFVVEVILLIEIGLVLVVLPWRFPDVWLNSPFVATHPDLRAFLANYFVRGAVSGLGIVDVFLGLWEAVHFRDRR